MGSLHWSKIVIIKSYGLIILCSRFHWPKAIVPYTIDAAFDAYERATIAKGIQHVEEKSCLRQALLIGYGSGITGIYVDLLPEIRKRTTFRYGQEKGVVTRNYLPGLVGECEK